MSGCSSLEPVSKPSDAYCSRLFCRVKNGRNRVLKRLLVVLTGVCVSLCAIDRLQAGEPAAHPVAAPPVLTVTSQPSPGHPFFQFARRDAIRASGWAEHLKEQANKKRRAAADVEQRLAQAQAAKTSADEQVQAAAKALEQAANWLQQQRDRQSSLQNELQTARAAIAQAKQRTAEADALLTKAGQVRDAVQQQSQTASVELSVDSASFVEAADHAVAAASDYSRSAEQAVQCADETVAEIERAVPLLQSAIKATTAEIETRESQKKRAEAAQAAATKALEQAKQAAKPFVDAKTAAEKRAGKAQSQADWAQEQLALYKSGLPEADPTTVRELKSFQHDRPVISCRIDSTGHYLFAGAQDNGIHRWDLVTGSYARLEGHESWVRRFALHPDAPLLISGDYSGNLLWWDTWLSPSQPLRRLAAHQGYIRGVALSPDGSLIATCGNDLLIRIWSADDGALLAELPGHERHVFNVAFHPDGRSLFSGDLMGVVKQWDVDDWRHVRDLDAGGLHTYDKTFRADCGGIRGIDFSPDGKQLAVCGVSKVTNAFAGQGTPTVVLFDLESGKRLKVMEPAKKLQGPCSAVRFHASGRFLVGTGGSGRGELWFFKPDEEKPFHTLKLPAVAYDLAFHPDNLRLAVALYDKTVRLYDLTAKTEVASAK